MTYIEKKRKSDFQARINLVRLAKKMISGELSFFEGSLLVMDLRIEISGIPLRDEDFDAFFLIYSETDHLPRLGRREFLSGTALEKLNVELVATENWARSFAEPACNNLITRFQIDGEE